ncbi:MAG: hypothetical protein P8N76_08890 [Pirellulaceae bacterium]|nr:hypothetical protein [Pirellulaceae bacterium]
MKRALTIGLMLWAVAAVQAEDRVILLDRQQRPVSRLGEVIRFDADSLKMQTRQGREIEIPRARVVRVESEQLPEHSQADARFGERNYKAALSAYQKAIRREERNWLKREILAQIIRCHNNLGNRRAAGSMFLILYKEDQRTLHFDAIPLVWRPWQPDREATTEATKWLDDPQPVAKLMAASWLLSTSKRSAAIRVLEGLKRSRDSRVQQLANAQLWRTQLVTTRKDIVLHEWPRALQQMPFELRGGPHFVLARALAKHGASDRSILEFMRVSIAYSAMYDLSAESLWQAGRQLEEAGNRPAAARIYREIIRDYPDTSSATQAQQRVMTLTTAG